MSTLPLLLVAVGAGLILLAAVGVLRFPDVLTRINAASKATGLGLSLVLLGVAVEVASPRGWTVVGLALLIQLVTTPASSHVLARAAYRSGAPLWEGTRSDDLREHYRRRPRPDGHPRTDASPPWQE